MERLDAAAIENEKFNQIVGEILDRGVTELQIANVHSMHNICAGLDKKVSINIEDSTGLYTCSFMENAAVTVNGNVGWYAGDNMVSGELIVKKNTGCNVGAYICGGNIVIYGNTGSRVGYGMRGGNIIVAGDAGRWAGEMAMGGSLIVLGKIGKEAGESMFYGNIYTRDEEAGKKLGGNVTYTEVTSEETAMLNELFEKYGLEAKGEEFHAIRPILDPNGKQQYKLFKPVLKPELANKFKEVV